MKQILYILLLNIIYVFTCLSQCDNNVSTDYNNAPTNNALPTNSPQPEYGENFLNTFNWVPRSGNQTLEKYQTINLSPDLLDQGEINNVYSDQQPSHYSYIYDNLEPNPQNGWELISVNMGYFPNGNIQSPTSDFTDFPYMILYNKYKSTLRVFGILGPGYADFLSSIDAVVVKMHLNDGENLNGLLRLSDGIDRTLDQETIINQTASVTKHPNQKGKWFSTDFQMAYDPCVCYFDSRLRFHFDFIETTQNFRAQINTILIEDDLVNNASGLADVDFLNNFNYTETGDLDYEASNGYLIYNAMDSLLDNYIAELQFYEDSLDAIGKHNEEVKRRKWIVKAGKFVLKAGTLALTGGSSAVLDIKTFLPLVAPEFMKGEDSLRDAILPEVQKLLGLGTNFLVSEWVGEEIDESQFPTEPAQPTATFGQSTMRGSITKTVEDYEGPRLRTPGSYGGNYPESNDSINTPHEYPVYNEALGFFALLDTPKVDISYTYDYNSFTQVNVPSITYTALNAGGDVVEIPFENATKVFREHITQISLKEDLRYTFNPALDIKDYSIEASFVFDIEVKNPNPRKHPEINSQGVMLNHDPVHSVIYPPVKSGIHDVNIESISFNVGENTTLEQGETYKVNTVYMPIDAFKGLTASVGMLDERIYLGSYQYALNQGWIVEQDRNLATFNDVYLKLLINVTFEGEKSDGSPHEYTYMFTYKVDDINTEYGNPLVQNLPGSIFDYTQYPENLILNAETFDGSQIDGCQLNGNTYHCKAWNDVELSGEFAVANNYEVIVEAGNEINVLPESIIPPEMIWQIAPVLDLSNPMPPVDAAYVQNFCQDENEYKARSGMIAHTDTDSIPSAEEREEDHFAFTVFPNPTSGRTTVSITLNEAAVGELFITAINGRRLGSAFANQRLPEGKSEHQLPTERLASGIYLVHLVVDGERHVKRLVKQ